VRGSPDRILMSWVVGPMQAGSTHDGCVLTATGQGLEELRCGGWVCSWARSRCWPRSGC
jgi:hypothetical protein